MPPQRVFPAVDHLATGEAPRPLPGIPDMPATFVLPTEFFSAGATTPFLQSPLEEWAGLMAACFV